MRENRYFLTQKWKAFADEIISWAKKWKCGHKKGTKLWRARVNPENKIDEKTWKAIPLDDDAMCAPPCDRAHEGRANPKGIPYLYLACDNDTAIWEVKPYLGKHVTLSTFELNKDVNLVDVSSGPLLLDLILEFREKELSDKERENLIWAYINTYFSIPISPEDDRCEYVPTQFLAELFKNNGFDGVQYRSSLKDSGHNVVLFDVKTASIKNKCVYRIHKILYETKKVA